MERWNFLYLSPHNENTVWPSEPQEKITGDDSRNPRNTPTSVIAMWYFTALLGHVDLLLNLHLACSHLCTLHESWPQNTLIDSAFYNLLLHCTLGLCASAPKLTSGLFTFMRTLLCRSCSQDTLNGSASYSIIILNQQIDVLNPPITTTVVNNKNNHTVYGQKSDQMILGSQVPSHSTMRAGHLV